MPTSVPSVDPSPAAHSKPHLVHVVGTLGAAGVGHLVLGMSRSRALARFRHSVVCTWGVQGELLEEYRADGISVMPCSYLWPDRLPIPSYRLQRWIIQRLPSTFAWRLSRTLGDLGADIVHSHISDEIHRQARAIIRYRQLPWVWTIHGLYRPEGAKLRQWKRSAKVISECRGKITVDSRAVGDDFAKRGVAAFSTPAVVHPGADVSRFSGPKSRDPSWRSRFGIPERALLFGSSGRLVTEKAYEIFVQAARLAASDRPEVHFAIAGRGPLQGLLEDEIKRCGLQGRFHLLGFQEDVPEFLRQLDVFVLSSRSEGFPLALIEALAAGLPCVATNVGGNQEMLGEHGGLVVPSESSDGLAQAIRQMLDPNLRRRLSEAAPALAANCSFESCASQFGQIYESLLA